MVVAAALVVMSMGSAVGQDVQKGENSFKKCLVCHAIGPGAKNKIGPELNGLDGRKAGTVPDYSVHVLMEAVRERGVRLLIAGAVRS